MNVSPIAIRKRPSSSPRLHNKSAYIHFREPQATNLTMATQNGEAKPKKQLIVNAFVMMCKTVHPVSNSLSLSHGPNAGSGHQSPGLWQHPDDESWRFGDVDHWVNLAKTLEEAKFHGIFIADVLGQLTLLFGRFPLSTRIRDLTQSCRRLRCLQAVSRLCHHYRCSMARQRTTCSSSRHGSCDEEHRLWRHRVYHVRAAVPSCEETSHGRSSYQGKVCPSPPRCMGYFS